MCGIGAASDSDEIEDTRTNCTHQPEKEKGFRDHLDQIQRGGVVLDIALSQRHWAADVALYQSDAQQTDEQELVAKQLEGEFEAQ